MIHQDSGSLVEQLYQSLFDHNPDGIYLLDLQGIVIDVNPAVERISGYAPSETLNRSFQTFVVPEDLERMQYYFLQALQGLSQNFDSTIYHKSGRLIDLNVTIVPNFKNGQVVGVFGVGKDITYLKQMEKELDHVRRDLDNTLSQQEGMTFKFKKINGRFVHTIAKGELIRRIGKVPEECVGKTLEELYPTQAEHHRPAYEAAWQGSSVQYEASHEGIYYVASLRPIWQHGRVVEVIASCVDITKRIKAEQELTTTKEQLESYIENNEDAILLYDKQGNLQRLNTSFERMFGWSKAEIDLGRSMLAVPEHLRDESIQMHEELRQGNTVAGYETVRQRKDGSLVHVLLSSSVIRGLEGQVEGWSLTFRDITEKKKTEELLLQTEKLSIVGQLAAGVAHEIRNPLTSLMGFVQLMRQNGIENKLYLELMHSELSRIDSIISELLVLAKPQSLSLKDKDLKGIVSEVVTLIETQAIMKNINIVRDFESGDHLVLCDSNQLKQVFINFFKNAIEAMEAGTITVQINRTDDEQLLVRIIDQGHGISEDLIHKLGEPFYSTKEKGTGLGLMVSKKIIDNHQGQMKITSEVNVGTTIEVRLPMAQS